MVNEPSEDGRRPTASRRRFLRAAGLATTALAGCTIRGGGFEVEIDEASDGTETPAPAQPTRTPTATPAGNFSVVNIPTVDPRNVPTLYPDETATGASQTATPDPVLIEVKNFRLIVESASDAVFDGSGNLELIGVITVNGDPASGGSTWKRNLGNPVQIDEGASESISMPNDPVVLRFPDPDEVAYRPENMFVIVDGGLAEADDGANNADLIDKQTTRWPLSADTGRKELTFTNGASRVELRYTIARQ